MPSQFLSCDWGTSSFRLRLVNFATHAVVNTLTDSTGIRNLYDESRVKGAPPRQELFAHFLSAKVVELIGNSNVATPLPIIISGMASSTIGWRDLPYANVPFGLDGTGLIIERLNWESPPPISATFLVSGAATATDMMRGEECQAVGIFADPSNADLLDRALLILPGTHSKHLSVDSGKITDIRTYMTGELFQILTEHSVLNASVKTRAQPRVNKVRAGIRHVQEHGLAASLFHVRARAVLQGADPQDNADFLSGILVGAECDYLSTTRDRAVIVVGSQSLTLLYQIAIPRQKGDRFATNIDQATVVAHRIILKRALE